MIKRSLVWLYNAVTYLLWAGVITATLLLLGLRYYVLPQINQQKDAIAQQASKSIGLKVTIGDIKAGWHGLRPNIELFNVDLYDTQNRPALTLEYIEAQPSWLSLAVGEVRLAKLVMHKPILTVRREQDGTIYVAGISMSGPSHPEFPNWLLRQSQVDILDASVLWQDDFRGAPPLALEKLSLRLSSSIWESVLERHHFGLQATPSAGSSKPIDIRGSLTGEDVSHPEQWKGTIYARLEGTDLAAWSAWVSYPFDIRQGHGAAQLWLEFSRQQADAVTADLQLDNVVAHLGQNLPLASLRNFAGHLAWKRLQDGQEIQAQQLSLLTANGINIQNGKVNLSTRQVQGKPVNTGDVSLDSADLEQLTTLASSFPLQPDLLEKLRGLSPKGKLQQLHLSWSSNDSKLTQYGLSSHFSQLGINPYADLPGFAGLAGSVDASQDGGTLALDASNARVDIVGKLNQTIPADQLSSRVSWKLNKGQLDVKVSKLAFSGSYMTGAVSGGYQRAANGDNSINLSGSLRLLGADGFDIRDGAVRVNTRMVDGKPTSNGDISLDDIRLEQVAAYTATLPLEDAWLDKLREIAPRGHLQQLHFSWSGDASGLAQYGLRSRFSELGMNPYQHIPGFSGLAGSVDASQDSGTLRLETSKAQLDLKDILRWPIPGNQLDGKIEWTYQGGKLALKVNALNIANPHLAGVFNASYQHSGNGSGEIDLSGKISRADAKYGPFYYPKTLSKDTLHWLDTSVLAGKSSDTAIIVRGNLDQFPWADNKHGLFQIKGTLSQGLLDYADNWPRVEDMQASLLFQGQRMELISNQGHLLGNRIVQAKAVIPDLDADHPVLKLTGELQSPAQEAINYVNNSPILGAIDRFTEHMQASGSGKLLLDLDIPLDTDGVGSKIKGSYLLSNGRLFGSEDVPTLEGINGRLDFTESSLRAQNISAQVFGGPMQFSLESGTGGLVHVSAQGRLSDNNLRQLIQSPLLDKLYGAADWNAEINMRKGQSNVLIKSSLVGLSSSLPEPFNKAGADALPLSIEKKTQDAQPELISASLGKLASAKLLRRMQAGNMRIERGEINFGGNAEIPAKPGLGLKGQIAHLDVNQWLPFADGTPDGKATDGISTINLSIGTLDMFNRRVNALKINANAITEGWKGTLQSDEINGEVQLQHNPGRDKVVARLKSLSVPSLAPPKLSAAPVQAQKESEYPALDVVAEEFNMPDKKLGKLEVIANPQGSDWNIEKVVVSNSDSTLVMDGKVQNWKTNPATSFNLTWTISDIGKTMDRYNKPDSFKGGKGQISGQLRWPGLIHAYDPSILDGNLSISAEDGQILKIQPGVGRLFSILSLQNLPRRLTFDFRDVFSNGFSFDKIDSRLVAKQGIVQIEKFRLEGAAAKVEMQGETNLVKETQNLHVKVTPALTGSLSLAAFAGGPAVGAAAWIAQKILQNPADKLAAYEFDVTGTWSDPQEISSKKVPVEPPPEASPFGN